MLARSRTLNLAPGELRSPLLIPSLSSKGFPIGADGLSEISSYLPLVIQDLNETMLISAYDIHHSLLPECDLLLGPEHQQSMYAQPELLVIDSGGYELSAGFESGETRRGPRDVKRFARDEFEAVVCRLPSSRPQLVVTFDSPTDDRESYQHQREIAQTFSATHPHLRIDFLLKPPSGERFISSKQLTVEASNLRSFDVIGVTEKELGESLLDRLLSLGQLRNLLDDAGAEGVPIHVFGSLDPLCVPLYFMAGAELFDGLSWLRYAYYDGVAVHPDELAVLTGSIEARALRRDAQRVLSNLQQITKLKHSLERWATEPDRWEHLGPHHVMFREIYDVFRARLRAGR